MVVNMRTKQELELEIYRTLEYTNQEQMKIILSKRFMKLFYTAEILID